ncbi:heterokaryon incompatibility protein-domain-containing protein [Stachybotrys elegans]|uniref:Heterokaryon incompatibility protein-domain-containing protein n=1 Tax=Stachybotrys elegans TaxID=80388 RepID=A0A8K0WIK2_9HYPO|nr:heterokaryon incompatibility protein-domain-containing protein [Stachybotrys elegans]
MRNRETAVSVCLWARHWRVTENKTKHLVEITYRLAEPSPNHHDLAGHGVYPLELDLSMRYDDMTENRIRLAMMAVGSNKGPDVATLLPTSTDSPESLQFLESSLKTCLDKHLLCRQRANSDNKWYPKRLMEIDATGSKIYLRDSQLLQSEPYITLSHCWGLSKPPLLTAKNAAAFTAVIFTADLPTTFRDAIMVTRQLSISYIWIDSLCIPQDDFGQWREEAFSMCDVYSHSLCNIAATGAPDGFTGLFFERDQTAECSFQITTEWTLLQAQSNSKYLSGVCQVFPVDHWTNDLELGPLNLRAWVMQERFLATRVLHFTKSQVCWECIETRSSEIFPKGIPAQAEPASWVDSQRRLKVSSAQTPRDLGWKQEMFNGWQFFCQGLHAVWA